MSHILKERLFRADLLMFVNEACCVIVNRIGVIEFAGLILFVRKRGDQRVISHKRIRIEEASSAVDRPVESIEAALYRPVHSIGFTGWICLVRDVPFSGHVG